MFLFIEIKLNVKNCIKSFQYIPCSYLSLVVGCMSKNCISFNTSHVPIYLITVSKFRRNNCCFNTSHVPIYRFSISNLPYFGYRFNTSHVPIYQPYSFNISYIFLVSIHPMFLFIEVDPLLSFKSELRFNTSHVPIYQTLF